MKGLYYIIFDIKKTEIKESYNVIQFTDERKDDRSNIMIIM